MTDTGSMSISPNYCVRDWLRLDLSKNSEWRRAAAIIDDRFNGRFFKMVDLINGEDFSGFAVLALDCLLIESLQQFRTGVDTTPSGQSGEYFRTFLTSGVFKGEFDGGTAQMFYKQFRCVILHQAEIKKSSKVWRVGPMVHRTSDGGGLIVNRRSFHARLRKAFSRYLRELRQGNDTSLRENAKKKMAYICRQ